MNLLSPMLVGRCKDALADCSPPASLGGTTADRHEKDKHNDEITSPLVRQLLAEDKATRDDAMGRIEDELSGKPKRVRSRVVHDLLRILSSTRNQIRKPASVRAAMTVLGRLKEPSALMFLVPYMTFPEHLPCLGFGGESNPCDSFSAPPSYLYYLRLTSDGMGLNIAESCPAVPALIQIGGPAIDPVARELATTREPVRIRCCLKVLKDLAKTDPAARAAIGKAMEKAWADSDVARIRRYSKLLDAEPDLELWSDKWER